MTLILFTGQEVFSPAIFHGLHEAMLGICIQLPVQLIASAMLSSSGNLISLSSPFYGIKLYYIPLLMAADKITGAPPRTPRGMGPSQSAAQLHLARLLPVPFVCVCAFPVCY